MENNDYISTSDGNPLGLATQSYGLDHLLAEKVRLYPYISEAMKKRALEDLLRERNNLALLSVSFLSKEEEFKHTYERKVKRSEEWLKARCSKTWLKHVVAEDCLKSLNVSKKWE